MEYSNADVNYDVYDYDEDGYVRYQHQYSLVYIDTFHCFYSNDYVYVNERNSIEMNFTVNYFFKLSSLTSCL